ncbi:MAG: 50S ribosomal protein L24 [Candidatus Micrarchaeota archaeon]|nr:50S ribosomal protein L24 [Candidatus Micrarchaeota archaeon]
MKMEDSAQPRKQRKFRFRAPLHLRKKMVSSRIGAELAAKLGTGRRSVPLRKGDKVKLMRGEHKGKTGKVMEVDLSTLKVYVEGITHRNAKGTEKLIPIDPSNLMLIEGEFSKDRLAMIARSPKRKEEKK